MKHYYAQYDTTVTSENPGFGFANTKKVIVFESKRLRDNFVSNRNFDMTSCSLTRRQAERMAYDITGLSENPLTWNVGVEIYNIEDLTYDLPPGVVVFRGSSL